MNHELMSALARALEEIQRAHRAARSDCREDLCQLLRSAEWKVVAAMADLVPDELEAAS